MNDPTTLDDLLAPLTSSSWPRNQRQDQIESVGANLARYFDALVEPALERLASDLFWKRRAALAVALGSVPSTPRRAEVLSLLLIDPHVQVSGTALLALRDGPDDLALSALRALAASRCAHSAHVRALALARDPADEPFFRDAARARQSALSQAGFAALGDLASVGLESARLLVESIGRAESRYLASEALASLASNMGEAALHAVLAASPETLALLERLVPRTDHDVQPQLRAIVTGLSSTPDASPGTTPAPASTPSRELAGFGALLDGASKDHPIHIGDPRTARDVARLLTSGARRSVVLVGPSGVGKTSLVHELTRLVRADGYVVLETSTGEVLAGTKYLGEWETRLKRLIDLAKAPARVILYVTDVQALATQGRTAQRDGSFADVLAPYLDRGELAILGEATDEALRSGIDRHDAFGRLFERVRVPEGGPSETLAVMRGRLAHCSSAEGVTYVAPPAVLDQLVEMASLGASGGVPPGSAVRLLDRMLERKRESRDRTSAHDVVLESSDVIAALSRSTGMPSTLLDDRQPFDRAAVRAFFEERVLDQPEAIDVVVELVTLVKAGLTDPDRPFGSLFFVGPTGVGKTELAKALAEHLYGASDRMIRVDMSELKQWDSHERLIGSAARPEDGILTRRITEQPFSVVLLDEIEKAHTNVHDLLLQLLDDGRLTDARGRTADFRRAVVVMTSNVGSRIDVDALGFGATGGSAPGDEAVMREMRKAFRPELLNRFGRVVVFRPLSADTVRTLVRRELGKVVLRSGVLRRRLSVDLAPELVDLLAREGFSMAYGARPLKRRVERRVLLPIAELIVSLGADAAGTILRAEVDGERVVVRAIAPVIDASRAPDRAPMAGRTLASARARLAELSERSRALASHPRRAEADGRRADLLARASGRTFWDDAERARGVMTELAELDDRESARASLERRLEGAPELLRDRGGASAAVRGHGVLDEIERALAMLEHRFLVEERGDRADVILTLTRIGATAESAQLLAELAAIYEAWAEGHDARATRLDATSDAHGDESITLHLDGHGLFGLFRGEAGLHRLDDGARGKDRRRFAARATVLSCPESPLDGTTLARAQRRDRTRYVVTHESTSTVLEAELPGRRAAARGGELERLLGCWLRARTEGPPTAPDAVVRRYGVDERFAIDESSGLRVRTKELASTGLDAIFEARVRARLQQLREAGRG